jgi:hypothetical protein
MAQCFRDQLGAANTIGKLTRLWLRTTADFALSLPSRHLERWLRRLRGGVPDGWTKRAMHATYFAYFEARSFSRREIGLEHLLLGILREDHDFATARLGPTGINEIVRAVETHDRHLGLWLGPAIRTQRFSAMDSPLSPSVLRPTWTKNPHIVEVPLVLP